MRSFPFSSHLDTQTEGEEAVAQTSEAAEKSSDPVKFLKDKLLDITSQIQGWISSKHTIFLF